MGTLKVNNIQSTTDGSVTFPQGSVNSSNSTINGNLSVSGTTTTNNIRFQDGSLSTPSVSFTNDTNTGLYRISEDKIGVSIGGVRTGEIGSGYGGFTGGIIQVLSTTKTDTFSTSSLSFVDITGLSVTITPKYSNSKIIIMISITDSQGSSTTNMYKIVRNSTDILIGQSAGSRTRATFVRYPAIHTGGNNLTTSFIGEDIPGLTTSIIYKIQMRVPGSTGYINRTDDDTDSDGRARAVSTITVMEVQQ